MNKKSKLSTAKATNMSLQHLKAQIKISQNLLEILQQGIPKKKYNRKKLTRKEMWNAITSKYPSLSCFHIDSPTYSARAQYQTREKLFNMIIEMKIHKSRHLTKKQKQKVEYEINEMIADKI